MRSRAGRLQSENKNDLDAMTRPFRFPMVHLLASSFYVGVVATVDRAVFCNKTR